MKEGPPKQIETPNRNSLIETIKPLIIPALMIFGAGSLGGDFLIQGGKPGLTFWGEVGLLAFVAATILCAKQGKDTK